jgi:hypothetical protein
MAQFAGFFRYEPLEARRRRPIAAGSPRQWTLTGSEVAARLAGSELVDVGRLPAQPAADLDAAQLAARLARVERTLARVRTRRLVRAGDALRRVQKGRSLHDVRSAWSLLRGARPEGEA